MTTFSKTFALALAVSAVALGASVTSAFAWCNEGGYQSAYSGSYDYAPSYNSEFDGDVGHESFGFRGRDHRHFEFRGHGHRR